MARARKGDLIISALDLPADLGKNSPRLVLWGDRHLLIENYGSFAAFSDAELKVGSAGRFLTVSGENFILEALTKNEIEICGKIESLDFTEAGDK